MEILQTFLYEYVEIYPAKINTTLGGVIKQATDLSGQKVSNLGIEQTHAVSFVSQYLSPEIHVYADLKYVIDPLTYLPIYLRYNHAQFSVDVDYSLHTEKEAIERVSQVIGIPLDFLAHHSPIQLTDE